jgi:hypothetical protein
MKRIAASAATRALNSGHRWVGTFTARAVPVTSGAAGAAMGRSP